MLSIRRRRRRTVIVVAVSGSVLLAGAFLILFNLSTAMSRAEAENRVRAFLSKQVARPYVPLMAQGGVDASDTEAAKRLERELRRSDALKFAAVDVRRLSPDVRLRPHMPTHVVRVVLQSDDGRSPSRYFWLPWSHIDSETSAIAWYLSI